MLFYNGALRKETMFHYNIKKEKCFDGIENYFSTHGIVVNKKNTALLQ